jgi:hypothetical protein
MLKKLKKLSCKLFGHSWLYNFTTLPNKIICKKCNTKMELNLSNFEWIEVDSFDPILGTDEEIKKRWVTYTK